MKYRIICDLKKIVDWENVSERFDICGKNTQSNGILFEGGNKTL